jgi:uncharacterized protein YndB with AHSA1/START domain
VTNNPEHAGETVSITHVFDAPIDEVFSAWTDPGELAAWYGPAGMSARRDSVHIDRRPGGRFELTMVSPDGQREFSIGYTIVEFTPPRLLVLKSDPMPHTRDGEPPTVRVELEDLGGQTRMTLTDGPMAFGKDHAEAGYRAAIAKLQAVLANR